MELIVKFLILCLFLHVSVKGAPVRVKIIESEADFEAELSAGGDQLIVVLFTADWCAACTQIKPVFKALAAEHPDVRFLKVNVDDVDIDFGPKYGVRGLPSILFFKHHEQVESKVYGPKSKHQLNELINRNKDAEN